MRALLAVTALSVLLPAQSPADRSDSAAAVSPTDNRFIVSFASRSFTLDPFREAVLARRTAPEVAQIVRQMERAVERDQADFVAAVEAAGGQVTAQYWIISAAAVTCPRGADWLRTLPNVAAVHVDRKLYPWLNTATDANHHGGDQANLRMVNGNAVRGQGHTVAILDTGLDADSGAGRPHKAFYLGANTNSNGGGIMGSLIKGQFDASGSWGTEDRNGHGTFVGGCSSANKWVANNNLSDDGFAPSGWLYNVQISSDASGGALFSAIIAGWQHVAAQRVAHNITVANNSYSGSPDFNDPTQQALDNTAFNADVLICVAAGNSNTNTSRSQHAYNGLAVGSIQKNSLLVSGFSCKGPLNGSGRTYPDIAAVGEAVYSVIANNETAVSAPSDGTSFASPMVAGAAALVRQANPTLKASEVKAILLNTTNPHIPNRNNYGLGLLRADNAVDAALATDVATARLTSAAATKHFRVSTNGGTEHVTATWFRRSTSPHINVDLTVYSSNGNALATDGNPENSYEKVTLQSGGPATFRATTTIVSPTSGVDIEVSVAGSGAAEIKAPTVTSLSPPTIATYQPAEVTITGTDLDFATRIDYAGNQITTFTVVSPTQLKFQPPGGLTIGQQTLVVQNIAGSSTPARLDVTGNHPAVLDGPVAVPGGTDATFTIYGDRNWISVLLMSSQQVPSVLPGVIDLEIGAFFTILWDLGQLPHGANGQAQFRIRVPRLFPTWWFYLEAVPIDPTNPFVLPFETSNSHGFHRQ